MATVCVTRLEEVIMSMPSLAIARWRWPALLLVGGLLLASTSACQQAGSGPTPTSAPTAAQSATVGQASLSSAPSSAPPTTVTVTATTPAYPSDYARAVLDAWSAHDSTMLALLVSDPTQFGPPSIPGRPDQHWTRILCEGAMGSGYCNYYNYDGDEIIIRTSNQMTAAHQWHAASLQSWNPITFPSSEKDYADEFIHAWIDGNLAREQLLSTTPVISYFATLAKIDYSYTVTVCTPSPGRSYFNFYRPPSFTETLRVINWGTVPDPRHHVEGVLPGC
jgi:hypothetical protein